MEKYSEQLIDFLSGFDGSLAYMSVFGILLACGLGLPIPEDITLIAAGILAGLGNISLTGALIVGFVGVLAGDAALFFFGRFYGRHVMRWPLFSWLFTPERVRLAEERLHRNSHFICFTARFLPGLRAPIFLTAGILRVSPITFFLLDGLAALISVPVWVVGAYYFAENLDDALAYAGKIKFYLLGFVASLFILYGIYVLLIRRRPLDTSRPKTNGPAA